MAIWDRLKTTEKPRSMSDSEKRARLESQILLAPHDEAKQRRLGKEANLTETELQMLIDQSHRLTSPPHQRDVYNRNKAKDLENSNNLRQISHPLKKPYIRNRK